MQIKANSSFLIYKYGTASALGQGPRMEPGKDIAETRQRGVSIENAGREEAAGPES